MILFDRITILFRVLNFVLLIVVLMYIFNRYIYKVIKQYIKDRRSYIVGLEQKVVLLEAQWYQRDEQSQKEQLFRESLKNKMKIWQQALVDQDKIIEQQRAVLYHQLQDRLKAQSAYMYREHLKSLVVPRALMEVKAELISFYAVTEQREKFIKPLISRLSESD